MAARLQGRHALVVGGSSGIGRAIAERFALEGAHVSIAARRRDAGEAVVAAIAEQGGKATFDELDVRDTSAVKALLATLAERVGPFHVAVNNAGVEGTPFTATADYDEAVFDAVIDTNLKGVWRCMKYEIPLMAAGGSIINMSSIAGLGANEMMGCAYTASKHGINGMTKTAAREYAPQGLRVNAICPGVIETDIAERSFMQDERLAHRVLKMHPLGRLGTVGEVADSAVFLASDESTFITGHTLVLDGGVSS